MDQTGSPNVAQQVLRKLKEVVGTDYRQLGGPTAADTLGKLAKGDLPINARNAKKAISMALEARNAEAQPVLDNQALSSLGEFVRTLPAAGLPSGRDELKPEADRDRWTGWFERLGRMNQAKKPQRTPVLPPAHAAYLEQVATECNVVWCPGMEGDSAGKMQLLRLYADLHTREAREKDDEDDDQPPSSARATERVSALKSVGDHHRLALLGEPGGGKSTLLRYLAVGLARRRLDPNSEVGGHLAGRGCPIELLDCTPIWVELRDPCIKEAADSRSKSSPQPWLWTAILDQIEAKHGNHSQELRPILEAHAKSGAAIFLLDGLDEITDPVQREKVKSAVWQLVTHDFDSSTPLQPSHRNRFLLTCRERTWFSNWRIEGWTAENGAEVRTLDLFDEDDRMAFLHQWFAEMAGIVRLRPASGTAAEVNELFAKSLEAVPAQLALAIKDPKRNPNHRLESLVSIPLNLTMIAWLCSQPQDGDKKLVRNLPPSRSAIYEQTIHAILWELDDHKNLVATKGKTLSQLVGIDPGNRQRFGALLAKIAFKSLKSDPLHPRPPLLLNDLLTDLASFYNTQYPDDYKAEAERVRRTIQCRAGLLKDTGKGFHEFSHRSFQEYLAAVHLVTGCDFFKEVTAWMRGKLDSTDDSDRKKSNVSRERLWEPLRLAFGFLSVLEEDRKLLVSNQKRDPATARELIHHLIREGKDANWNDVWLAGELWLELEPIETPEEPWLGLKCTLKRRLVDLIEAGAMTPFERASAGRVLGQLGDPRPGVQPQDLVDLAQMEFCYVPGDPPGKAKKAAQGDDAWVGYDFWIGRFPVTVAQFRLFAKPEARNYANDNWWKAAKDEGFWQDGRLKVTNSFGHNAEWVSGPATLEPRFDVPNHPMVMVNWFEARAFAAWLNDQLRKAVLLPDGSVLRLATEREWQRAAQGGRVVPGKGEWVFRRLADQLSAPTAPVTGWSKNLSPDREFPWGDEAIGDRANWHSTGIGATSAVGCFPKGRSPVGAEEMAGNVWEWTGDWYDDVPKHRRVLRGGSWVGFVSGDLDCAGRGYGFPGSRDDGGGFRCVVVRAAAGR